MSRRGEKRLNLGGNVLGKLLTAEQKQRVALALGHRAEAIKWGLEAGRYAFSVIGGVGLAEGVSVLWRKSYVRV